MEEFTSAVGSVCAVSALICVMRMISGGTRLKSQAELLMKLVLGMAVAAVFTDGISDFELPETFSGSGTDYSIMSQIYDEELAARAGENISEVLSVQLRAAGIDPGKIKTEVNILQDGSITISRVVISTEEYEAAAAVIRSSLGQETEVVNGDS